MIHAVTAIVLNWNNASDTLACLASLAQQDAPHNVLVVDNGSTDDSVARIAAAFPAVEILQMGENLGYAGGNNAGIRKALEDGAECIVLLNNDTVADPAMLTGLVEVMRTDSAIGAVSPKILYYDDPGRIWCAGASIDWRTGSTRRLCADEVDADRLDTEPVDVDFGSGCALMLRREALESVGLLDEDFFLYYEETDWCVRAAVQGWRVVCVPGARVFHKVSASLGAASPITDYYMSRNVLRFLGKNAQGLGRSASQVRSVMSTIAAITAYTLKPRGGVRRAHRDARFYALRDALLGKWGEMGADVAVACGRSLR
ncbi:MAG: glycosyltransferase family 2 protein [Anaerolineae bacterium]